MQNVMAAVTAWLSRAPVFLSGALVATVVALFIGGLRARRDRKIAWLQDQLRFLYGPISCLTNQNAQLFKLIEKIHDEHQKSFSGQHTEDETRQEALVRMSEHTIGLGNLYAARVAKNNARVMEIIDTHWHLADSTDRDILSQFQLEYIRYLTECKEGGTRGVPMRIVLDELGLISFMRPEMISRVDAAFQEEQRNMHKERTHWR